jgi:hypothetical protein
MGIVSEVKHDRAAQTLVANLANGQDILEKKKQPATDQEVLDLALAKGHAEYPKLWEEAIEQYKLGGDNREEAVKWARELLKKDCMTKFKRYVQAIDHNLDDDNALNDRVSRSGTNYASPAFKQLQYQSMFRHLGLEKLAALCSGQKVEADLVDSAAFDVRSPIIQELWAKFGKSDRLRKLFPLVEDINDFWRELKRCMRYMGFKQQGGTARAARDKKNSRYYVGWVIRCESGSAFFRANYEIFLDAVRSYLDTERLEYRRRASHSPPDEDWGVAA